MISYYPGQCIWDRLAGSERENLVIVNENVNQLVKNKINQAYVTVSASVSYFFFWENTIKLNIREWSRSHHVDAEASSLVLQIKQLSDSNKKISYIVRQN